jgi:V/A-type H+-transporting ATPase subunit D
MSMGTLAPTRMNLLKQKAQIKMAADGAELLKGKRDALMQELIGRARQLRDMRNELHKRGRTAEASLAITQAVRGTPELKSAAIAGRRNLHIEVKTEKIWGLSLGSIHPAGINRAPAQRGMGLLDISAHIHEAGEEAESMLEQLLISAPMERNLQIIGEEVKKVSRRINALEEYLLPKLRGEVRAIESVLEEREREDMFRLKKIKGKKAAQKASQEKAQREHADVVK